MSRPVPAPASAPLTPPRTPPRVRPAARVPVTLLAVALCLLIGLLGSRSLAGSSSAGSSTGSVSNGSLGVADGVVPDGVTVFDDRHPAVTRLDPDLLRALRAAASDAARSGVEMRVNSGWRSARYQQRLFEEAVGTYGSEAAAARWVARPGTSVHEAGAAVDIGPDTAAAWLGAHGAAYGLCRVYRNEPWHFELRPAAARHGCPAAYADPTHDPRMQP